MKTLKDMFEVYRPKAQGEQDFVDKHVVIKHKDRNGNGDDVFNGKVKPVDRKKTRLGYDPGDDEKVYEEVEDLDELSRATVGRYSMKAKSIADNEGGKDRSKGRELAGRKKWGGTISGVKPARVPATNEEVEDLDELSRKTLASYVKKAGGRGLDSAGAHGMDYGVKLAGNDFSKSSRDKSLKKAVNRATGVERAADRLAKEEVEIDEAVSVSHDRYLRSHGKKASGSGGWIFTHKKSGNIDLGDEKSSHIGKGKFSDAAKSAKEWAKKHGHTTIYVAEDFNEEVEIDEAVSVSHDRYLRSHGKKASGSGGWIFTHKKSGNIDLGDEKSSHIGKGKFSDAAKSAKEWAKKHGHTTIYVAEDFNEEVVRNAILEMAEIEGLDLTEEELEDLVVSMIEEVEELDEAGLPDYSKHSTATLKTLLQPGTLRRSESHLKRAIRSELKKRSDVNEEVEDLDELSKDTLGNYVKKASNRAVYHTAQQMTAKDVGNMEYHGKKVVNRLKGLNKAATKLTKEDVINRAIEKYASIDESNLPTRAERLVSKLDGMSESHIYALLGLFDSLNEDNQMKMLATADTHEGVLSLLDFAIANRGE